MQNRDRREFLLGATVAAAELAASSLPFADSRKIGAGIATPEGVATVANSCSGALPDGMTQSDSGEVPKRGKIRGLMVDAGRVPEPIEYYRRVIEFCVDWGLNALQIRLADDQGSALRFASVPDLVVHGNAFMPEQLKSLAEFAASHGVDLIPELESFGHTGFITRSAAYAHLLDREAQGESEFTGVIPVHPESLQLFGKLYREIASIFPSIYLHGGCDEVNWGGSALSRKALQAKTRAQIWAEYLNALNGIANGLGKQFIVWGDMVLRKEPKILSSLNKNIIVMDWSYYDNSSASIRESFLKVRANGFRGIGAPALSCYRWGARVGVEQLRNIDAMADAYLGASDEDSLGVILTNWIPSRYIQNSIWDGFAYAAVAFNEGTATAQTSGFRRFVEKHYRASWNEEWNEAFHIVYESAPGVQERETVSWMGLPLRIPWSSDEQFTALLKDFAPRANPFTKLRSLLVELEPLIEKNLADFQAFELCAEYLERTFWRDAVVVEHAGNRADRETRELLIQTIAERDRDLGEALSRDWDKGRFPDSAAKREPLFDLEPKDQLLLQWQRAAVYSAKLASDPDRFHRLLQAANRG